MYKSSKTPQVSISDRFNAAMTTSESRVVPTGIIGRKLGSPQIASLPRKRVQDSGRPREMLGRHQSRPAQGRELYLLGLGDHPAGGSILN